MSMPPRPPGPRCVTPKPRPRASGCWTPPDSSSNRAATPAQRSTTSPTRQASPLKPSTSRSAARAASSTASSTPRSPGPSAIPYDDQPGWRKITELPTPEQRLRAYVAFSCDILERTRPVHTIIRSAAESEPRAADLRARQLRLRLTRNTKHLDDFVGTALRPGLSLKEAAEHYCALSSPELYELLTVQLGWSRQRHQRWLANTVQRELLATD